jgi:hypothetical protein
VSYSYGVDASVPPPPPTYGIGGYWGIPGPGGPSDCVCALNDDGINSGKKRRIDRTYSSGWIITEAPFVIFLSLALSSIGIALGRIVGEVYVNPPFGRTSADQLRNHLRSSTYGTS